MRIIALLLAIAVMALFGMYVGFGALGYGLKTFLEVVITIVIILVGYPFIPGAIDMLTNKPNAGHPEAADTPEQRTWDPNEFGFFTYLTPGRVKIIERGGTFVRCIMNFPGHMFAGEEPGSTMRLTDADYWEVKPTIAPATDSDPLAYEKIDAPPVLKYFLWLWVRWVYKITGAVYTGIYPFQRVRVYEMTKNIIAYQNAGKYELKVKADWSDHLRVADFQFPLLIPDVNTQDKIAVKMTINNIFRVFNPFKTAYFTDNDWGSRLLSSVSAVVTNFGRAHPLNEVLSATSTAGGGSATDTSMELANGLAKVGYHNHGTDPDGSTAAFGIMIPDPERNPPQILDITAVNDDDIKKLGDVARAKVDAEAEGIRAQGRAAELREQGAALREFPEAAIIPEIEGRVRTAEAAGDKATIIMSDGGGRRTPDAMLAAILKAIRERP